MHFEIAPLHRLEAVRAPDQNPFAGGLLGLAGEEARLIDAIDRPILRNGSAGNARQCREQVDPVNNLVTDSSGGHFARPADQEWHANAAFQGRKVLATPWP